MRILVPIVMASLLAITAHTEGSPEKTLAEVDLMSAEGVSLMRAAWRYHDVSLVPTTHRAPDATGQPTGEPTQTFDYEPHAGVRDFDDSSWPAIGPKTLTERRGPGRISFGWYRINLTVPERIGDVATAGSRVEFETSVDDYAEVWVDGELPRALAQQGGSVIAGWNAVNRLPVARNLHAGQVIHIAVFGINGPISDPPSNFLWMRLARLKFYPDSNAGEPTAVPAQEVNVQIVRKDRRVEDIVPANAKLFKVAQDFKFTEGPIWVGRESKLLFSDPNANRIYAYDPAQQSLKVWREKSGYDGADIADYGQPGSNGLTLSPTGVLTVNQHGKRRVVRLESGAEQVLADRFQGKRLNSPNDLVYRSDGSLYFTDPPFGLPKFFDDPRKELPFSGVFRVSRGKVSLESRELSGPNGIAFSPDEKFLYVDNWDPARKVVLRFPVRTDGSLGTSQVFADMTAEIPGDEALDGMKVDQDGNLYVSAPDGVRIYAPDGTHLGTIVAPRPVHNFAWGGADGRTLYLCARDRLYRIDLKKTGIRP